MYLVTGHQDVCCIWQVICRRWLWACIELITIFFLIVKFLHRSQTNKTKRELDREMYYKNSLMWLQSSGSPRIMYKLENQKGWWCKLKSKSKVLRSWSADVWRQEEVDVPAQANSKFSPFPCLSVLQILEDAHLQGQDNLLYLIYWFKC